MTPEELEAMKKLVDGENDRPEVTLKRPEDYLRTGRDPGLIRAELLDALEDYSRIFIEKSELEMERCWAVKGIIARVQSGLEFEQADIEMKTANEWIQRYRLLNMRFQEMQMRVNRLILEYGTNNGMA